MIPGEFLTALFYEVAAQLRPIPPHPEARLGPREVGTLGLLQALKGVGNRASARWLARDSRPLCPLLPERTRLFRLFRTPQDWPPAFWAAPTVRGGIDPYGIERIHPMRAGRRPQLSGRPGLSHQRWMVGGQLGLLLHQAGVGVAGAGARAKVAENPVQWLMRPCEERLMVLSETGFHAAEGDPTTLTLCQRGAWQDRLLVETGLSVLIVGCHCKRGMPRGWAEFQARLAFTMAAFHGLGQWHGFQPTASGFVPLSIAALRL